MTPSERDRAFNRSVNRLVRREVDLQRATRDDLAALLEEARRAIAEILAGQPSDYARWSLPLLSADIGGVLQDFGDEGAAKLGAAASQSWHLGIDQTNEPLNAAGVRIGAALPRIDATQLSAMRAFMVDRIKDVGVDSARRISAELGLVVIGARSPSDAISAVKRILGEIARDRATTIVRTELGRVFSVAAQESLAAAADRVPGLQKRWRRSAKTHPRLHHFLADGQVRDVTEPFVLKPLGKAEVELMFPRDPTAPAGETINCGCVSVPFKRDWKIFTHEELTGLPRSEPVQLVDLSSDGETVADVLARQKARAPA